MKVALACGIALLLVLPVAATQAGSDPVDPRSLGSPSLGSPSLPGEEESSCGPPCGYIQPLIALDFEGKPACRPGADEECLPMPEADGSLSLEGQLKWYWEVSQDGTYPSNPGEDIVISFSGTAANPAPFDVSVTPTSFTLTNVELADPSHFRLDTTNPTVPRIWFEYVAPITVTITRSDAALDEDDRDRVEARDGVLSVFLRAKSSPSGTQYYAGFGLEEFRFDAGDLDPAQATPEFSGQLDSDVDDAKDTPFLGLSAVFALLAFAALRRRR